jgi:hypothetical protein
MITSRFSTANGDTASLAFRISNDSNPDDTIKAAIFFKRTAAGNGRGDFIFANNNTANSNNVTSSDVGITIAAGGGITMPNVSAGTTTGSMCMSSAGVVFFNTGTNACISSTRSSKHDINYIENMGLEQILNLNPVTYIYNDDSANRTRLGFIAEDVAAINPLFASYGSNGLPNGLSDYGIEAASVQAIKDLNSKVDLATGSANTHILNLEKDLSLTTDGNLAVIPTVDTDFKVQNSGKDVTRVGAFAILVVAKIRAGIVNAQEIATNSLSIATDNITVSGQRLSDYIGTIVDQRLANYNGGSNNNQIAVNIISPLDQSPTGKVTVKLNDNKGKSKLEIQNASGSAVASFDSAGNATLSGELSANGASISGQLSASDASVSGTLRAGHIIADDIDGLDARIGSLSATTIVNNNYYSTPSGEFNSGYNASGSGSFDSLFAKTAEFEQGLMSFGSSTFFEASVANRLFVGTQLSIADNSINVLGGNLRLQPLGSGGVSFVADKVQIDTDGNLTVNGNATFAKNVAVGGKLYTKVIAPFPNQDLSLELGSGSSQLQIKGASNSGVIAISNKGDLNASGAGTFNKLNLSFVPQALAVSDIEVVATGSAGTVTLNANKPEITIDNTLVTPDSLIYITPVGQTWGESIYLSRQVAGESFTVGISGPTDHDIKFNFLIIN